RGSSRSVSPQRRSRAAIPSSSGASRDRHSSASAPDRSPPRSGALAFASPTSKALKETRDRLALLRAVLSGPAAAQRQQPAARGATSITMADVQRRIGIIADDSMLGRATPSRQLDAVAAYVAGEFQRFGLKPGGDSGTYFQHYPLEIRRVEPESSIIRITGRAPGIWRGGQDRLLADGQPPAGAA